ncbi:hypothetical protein [Kitasatospora sp. NPDC088351]|uniref:hypothetical protein n=1 Tax=Kitasatospora sp. NPDC088351 TaxID=3155180 RepID=UPI00342CB7F5
MRRATIALLTAGLIATATACSSSSDKSEGPSTPTATNGATLAKDTAAAAPGTATTTATPAAAAAAFTAVAKAVPTAKLGKTVTAEDDPNHLLGRPGQYTSKVTFTDSLRVSKILTPAQGKEFQAAIGG